MDFDRNGVRPLVYVIWSASFNSVMASFSIVLEKFRLWEGNMNDETCKHLLHCNLAIEWCAFIYKINNDSKKKTIDSTHSSNECSNLFLSQYYPAELMMKIPHTITDLGNKNMTGADILHFFCVYSLHQSDREVFICYFLCVLQTM